MYHFPQIAGLTKGLSINLLILSPAHNGNDMIQNQLFCASAPRAAGYGFSGFNVWHGAKG